VATFSLGRDTGVLPTGPGRRGMASMGQPGRCLDQIGGVPGSQPRGNLNNVTQNSLGGYSAGRLRFNVNAEGEKGKTRIHFQQ